MISISYVQIGLNTPSPAWNMSNLLCCFHLGFCIVFILAMLWFLRKLIILHPKKKMSEEALEFAMKEKRSYQKKHLAFYEDLRRDQDKITFSYRFVIMFRAILMAISTVFLKEHVFL